MDQIVRNAEKGCVDPDLVRENSANAWVFRAAFKNKANNAKKTLKTALF